MNLTSKQRETISKYKISGLLNISIGIPRHADIFAHYVEGDYKSLSAVIQKAIDDFLDNNPNRLLNEIRADVKDLLRRVDNGVVVAQEKIEPEINSGFDDTGGFSE